METKRRGRKLLPLISRTGSRIALSQDKQLSQPTPMRIIVRYATRANNSSHSYIRDIIHPTWTLRCDTFREKQICEICTQKITFRKRPFALRLWQGSVTKTPIATEAKHLSNKYRPNSPHKRRLTESTAKIQHFS